MSNIRSGELRSSLPWALLIGFPMALFAASVSMWFAHSAGWLGILLFAPAIGVLLLAQHGAPLASAPQPLILWLVGLFQFAWCWLGVLLVRAITRRLSRNAG